jgi:hypothetical protein
MVRGPTAQAICLKSQSLNSLQNLASVCFQLKVDTFKLQHFKPIKPPAESFPGEAAMGLLHKLLMALVVLSIFTSGLPTVSAQLAGHALEANADPTYQK